MKAVVDRHGRDKADKVPAGAHEASAEDPALTRDPKKQPWGDDWVHELIAMTRPGVEIEFPIRSIEDRAVPFVYDDFD